MLQVIENIIYELDSASNPKALAQSSMTTFKLFLFFCQVYLLEIKLCTTNFWNYLKKKKKKEVVVCEETQQIRTATIKSSSKKKMKNEQPLSFSSKVKRGYVEQQQNTSSYHLLQQNKTKNTKSYSTIWHL